MTKTGKTATEIAVFHINRTVAEDIASIGGEKVSMGYLTNSFNSAIYSYLEKIGTSGQALILGDPAAGNAELETGEIDLRSVSTALSSMAYCVLQSTMQPKIIEICSHLNKGRGPETLDTLAQLFQKASLENDPSLDLEAFRNASVIADEMARGVFNSDSNVNLTLFQNCLEQLSERRRDKSFMTRLGTSINRLVALSDRVSDMLALYDADPVAFEDGFNELPSKAQSQPSKRFA
jgi:hypothetical protein